MLCCRNITQRVEVGAVGERITVSVSVFLLVLISHALSVITICGNLNIGLQLFISYFWKTPIIAISIIEIPMLKGQIHICVLKSVNSQQNYENYGTTK